MLYYYQNNFIAARNYSEELYKIDPDSAQIINLHKAICYKHNLSLSIAEKEQQEIALTVAGVALGVVTVGLGILFSMKKKWKKNIKKQENCRAGDNIFHDKKNQKKMENNNKNVGLEIIFFMTIKNHMYEFS